MRRGEERRGARRGEEKGGSCRFRCRGAVVDATAASRRRRRRRRTAPPRPIAAASRRGAEMPPCEKQRFLPRPRHLKERPKKRTSTDDAAAGLEPAPSILTSVSLIRRPAKSRRFTSRIVAYKATCAHKSRRGKRAEDAREQRGILARDTNEDVKRRTTQAKSAELAGRLRKTRAQARSST